MWESAVNGERLKFRLVGINNQNFIMADDRTNTWWQQVNGTAILGPKKGARLTLVPADIVSFATWRADHPQGRVLAPDPEVEKRDGEYLSTTWEREMATFKTVTPLPKGSPFEARQLVVGVRIGALAKAWSLDDLKKARVQLDQLADVPLMIVVAEDGKSVRVFDRRIDGKEAEFVAPMWGRTSVLPDGAWGRTSVLPDSAWGRTSVLPDSASSSTAALTADQGRTEVLPHMERRTEVLPHMESFIDVDTGSHWDFAGRAISGPLQGRTLARIPHLLEYWFDWQTYQPKTLVHKPWNPVKAKPDPLTVPKPKE